MSPSEMESSYRTILNSGGGGETITVRRPGTPNVDVACLGRMGKVDSNEDLGGQSRTTARVALVMYADLVSGGFPLPIRPNTDKLIWAGKTMAIVAVDDSRRRVSGTIVALDLVVNGA